jgi:glycosyltransferase involved in cell wall biosynthesis
MIPREGPSAMNIVFVNPEYPSRSAQDHGGIATYIYSMANALANAGHTVHVLAKTKTNPDTLAPGVVFHPFDHEPLIRMFPWFDSLTGNDTVWERGYSCAARNMILELHKTTPVDIVEIAEFNGLAYEFNAPLPFPVVIHFHTPTEIIDRYNEKKITSRQRRWYKYEAHALKRAAGFRCPSNSLKKEVCRMYGIPEEQVRIIPHPLGTAAFDAINRVDGKKNVIDILFSGRLERRKGGEILQRDIGRILSIDPRINLTFAGELDMGEAGSFRNPIERSLTEEQRHRIWLLGPVKRGDLPVLYRHSDIFLIPSLFENAPYALLEAMAARLPVIGADTSGIAELIRNNENGVLFNPSDPDSLVLCIKSMISAPPEASEGRTQRAYDYIKRTCDTSAVAGAAASFYADVIRSFAKHEN